MSDQEQSGQIESYVNLKILSDTLSPEEIASFVDLAPDDAWRAGGHRSRPGDHIARSVPLEKQNGWVLKSSLPRTEDLAAHIENVLDRASSSTRRIKLLAGEHTIELSCAVYVLSKDILNPSLYLEEETVSRISALGANFDLDLYFWADEE